MFSAADFHNQFATFAHLNYPPFYENNCIP